MKSPKARKPLFQRLKTGLEEGIRHAKGEITLKTTTLELPDRPPEVGAEELDVGLADSHPLMTRILGLDYGMRRVGAALSDPGRTIAFPAEVYGLRGLVLDARHYCEIVRENDVERIVIGLPLHTSGREGELASRVRTFGDWLAAATGRPVVYFDERYTTVEAEQRLLDAGLTRQRRKALRDQLAAQIMLQSYLDAGCPLTEVPATPLADSLENDS